MKIISSLYEEPFDFKKTFESPRIQIMLAATPRSGSTFFCLELWKTGVLGAPMEYPNVNFMGSLKKRLDAEKSFDDYWRKVQQVRTSPNGVFSYKMFMTNYVEISRKEPESLRHFSPDVVIHLRRKDIHAQAISYSKAIRSQAWFADSPVLRQPDYDRGHIAHCENMLLSQYEFWNKTFEITKTKVLTIYYEDLINNVNTAVGEVAKFAGIGIKAGQEILLPELQTQRDSSSLEWSTRYKKERVRPALGEK